MPSDEDAIRTTIAEYCHSCDDGRFDDWIALYTPDATFSVMGNTHKGHDEIKGFITKAQPPELRGKHMTFNSVIEVDGDTATARTDFAFLRKQGDVYVTGNVGRYHDVLRRDPDRWRFVERRIVFPGEEG